MFKLVLLVIFLYHFAHCVAVNIYVINASLNINYYPMFVINSYPAIQLHINIMIHQPKLCLVLLNVQACIMLITNQGFFLNKKKIKNLVS